VSTPADVVTAPHPGAGRSVHITAKPINLFMLSRL
jgi:hypothetical protein